jgi:hypothetical protein
MDRTIDYSFKILMLTRRADSQTIISSSNPNVAKHIIRLCHVGIKYKFIIPKS